MQAQVRDLGPQTKVNLFSLLTEMTKEAAGDELSGKA